MMNNTLSTEKPTPTPSGKPVDAATACSAPKLYEITALVNYSVVIRADSKEEALKHVETWEHAWDRNSDLVGVSDVDLCDVRDGGADEAHEDISQNNRIVK